MGALKQRSTKTIVALIAGGVPLALFGSAAMADTIHNANNVENEVHQRLTVRPSQRSRAETGDNSSTATNTGTNSADSQTATGGAGSGTVASDDGVQLNDGSDVTGTGGDATNKGTQTNKQRGKATIDTGAADSWNDLHLAVTQANTGGASGTQDGGGNTIGNVLNDEGFTLAQALFGGYDTVHNWQGVDNEVHQRLTVSPRQRSSADSGDNSATVTNTGTNASAGQTATGGDGTATVAGGTEGSVQASASSVDGTGGAASNTGPQTNDQGATSGAKTGKASSSNSGQITVGQTNGGGASGDQSGGDNNVGNVMNDGDSVPGPIIIP